MIYGLSCAELIPCTLFHWTHHPKTNRARRRFFLYSYARAHDEVYSRERIENRIERIERSALLRGNDIRKRDRFWQRRMLSALIL